MRFARWRVYARRAFRRNILEIHFLMKGQQPNDPEYRMDCKLYEMKEEDHDRRGYDEELPYKPLELPEEAAQMLMDELYAVGIRPTEGMGSAGSMAAAQEHLKTVKDYSDRLMKLVEEAWKWGRE